MGEITRSGIIYDGSARKRPELLENPRPGEHIWIAVSAHVVQTEVLRRNEPLQMDGDNLAEISVGCYVCEQPYSDRLSYRRCTGEPK